MTLFPSTQGANLSDCGRYRYLLWRRWQPSAPVVNFIMLNPSTADAVQDDPTATRCIRRAQRWGFGGLVVTNLFAFRATDPTELGKMTDPVGPENDEIILGAAAEAATVVCGWGNHGRRLDRGREVRQMLRQAGIVAKALNLTKAGEPGHPLYIGYSVQPFPLEES